MVNFGERDFFVEYNDDVNDEDDGGIIRFF